MTQAEFHKLVHLVLESPAKPPAALFEGGMDNWRARARLAHFLAMPGSDKKEEALHLFRTVVPEEIDEENAQDVEEKIYALQRLALIEKDDENTHEKALEHIGHALDLAENTDYLYKYILRGELWGDRWNIMQRMGIGQEAEQEADERIEAYTEIPIEHNSYLYYAYRFKAMRAAESGIPLVAKDHMRMALHAVEIPDEYKEGIERAFSAKHENTAWILNEIDRATPPFDRLHWDI